MFANFFKKKNQAGVKTNVTREEVERIVQHDFPAEQHNDVLKILNEFRYSEGFREVAQKMILEEAKGNIEKVKKYAKYADQVHGDFRDLALGLESMRTKPCDGKNHHLCNGQVRQKWDSGKGETLWECSRCGGKYEFEVLVEKNLLTQSQAYAICNWEFCGTCELVDSNIYRVALVHVYTRVRFIQRPTRRARGRLDSHR